jgi:hypothetical protein
LALDQALAARLHGWAAPWSPRLASIRLRLVLLYLASAAQPESASLAMAFSRLNTLAALPTAADRLAPMKADQLLRQFLVWLLGELEEQGILLSSGSTVAATPAAMAQAAPAVKHHGQSAVRQRRQAQSTSASDSAASTDRASLADRQSSSQATASGPSTARLSDMAWALTGGSRQLGFAARRRRAASSAGLGSVDGKLPGEAIQANVASIRDDGGLIIQPIVQSDFRPIDNSDQAPDPNRRAPNSVDPHQSDSTPMETTVDQPSMMGWPLGFTVGSATTIDAESAMNDGGIGLPFDDQSSPPVDGLEPSFDAGAAEPIVLDPIGPDPAELDPSVINLAVDLAVDLVVDLAAEIGIDFSEPPASATDPSLGAATPAEAPEQSSASAQVIDSRLAALPAAIEAAAPAVPLALPAATEPVEAAPVATPRPKARRRASVAGVGPIPSASPSIPPSVPPIGLPDDPLLDLAWQFSRILSGVNDLSLPLRPDSQLRQPVDILFGESDPLLTSTADEGPESVPESIADESAQRDWRSSFDQAEPPPSRSPGDGMSVAEGSSGAKPGSVAESPADIPAAGRSRPVMATFPESSIGAESSAAEATSPNARVPQPVPASAPDNPPPPESLLPARRWAVDRAGVIDLPDDPSQPENRPEPVRPPIAEAPTAIAQPTAVTPAEALRAGDSAVAPEPADQAGLSDMMAAIDGNWLWGDRGLPAQRLARKGLASPTHANLRSALHQDESVAAESNGASEPSVAPWPTLSRDERAAATLAGASQARRYRHFTDRRR